MIYKLTGIIPLVRDMACTKQDIDAFAFSYANVHFECVLDIGRNPFELLLGARGHRLALILPLKTGYNLIFSDEDFYLLCSILKLKPGKNTFTSWMFLEYLNSHFPEKCSGRLVQPSTIMRFRKPPSDISGRTKDVFWGWNDHRSDGRTARNFAITERYFGKHIADFCRAHNISSIWHYSDEGFNEKPAVPPPGY